MKENVRRQTVWRLDIILPDHHSYLLCTQCVTDPSRTTSINTHQLFLPLPLLFPFPVAFAVFDAFPALEPNTDLG